MSPLPPPRPDAPGPSHEGLALSMESSFLGFFAHAGFLRSLRAAGIRPAFYAGASSGSLLAVLAGAGYDDAEIRALIFDPAFKYSFWEPSSFARMIGMTFWLRGATGFTSGARTRRYLLRAFAGRAERLEDCRHGEVSVAVANLTRLRTEILTRGEAAAAVVASCAFPCLVAPQAMENGHCWDGGIANSCPILHYAEDPRVRTVIAHHIRHPGRETDWTAPGFRPRISDTIGRGHELITRELREFHLRALAASGKELLRVRTIAARPGPLAGRALLEKCYQAGVESGEKFAAEFTARAEPAGVAIPPAGA